ncbi:MAG: penicillin-binding protein 2 [Clostridia bacterium]|nr:penicillin-binding protein 2 [Clostridia bacterium]
MSIYVSGGEIIKTVIKLFYSSKRILSLYMLFTACFMAILGRIAYISFSSYSDAAESRSGRTVLIGTTRGKIYDRNREPLVDTSERLVAAVTPVTASGRYLSDVFSSANFSEKIEKGYPFVATVTKEIDNELIKTFGVPVRYSHNDVAAHTVGYVDSGGNGVTGIEKAFDKELSGYGGKLWVTFEVDALGRVLAGMDKRITDENFNSAGGVVLTLDKRVQQLTEEALMQSNIKSGCAVVMHIDSGDIYALASVPSFDRNNVEASLEEENSPLVNKALSSYSAGSVFKSLVAAFALEKGISEELTHNCTGSIEAGSQKFSCYGQKAHGKVNMSEALQKSCNTYFIRLMERLDVDEFVDFCRKLGLGESIRLCDGVESEGGQLPDKKTLASVSGRANFAFGQGDLLVTPLQMVKAYHVLAMGTVIEPRLIYGFCNGRGEVAKEGEKIPRRLLSDKTVSKMRQFLFEVTESGVGGNAKSELMKLAGKTGTAQSGVYNENGEEINRTWFVGFYPANNPHYIVAVMNENGTEGNLDCAPVYKNICEWIACDSLRR